MKNAYLRPLLLAVALLVAASGVMQADAISGSLPFAIVNATQNGANLLVSTKEASTGSITTGVGAGDFSVVPLFTVFSVVTLDNTTVGGGGSFTLSNATYGSFVATGGSIVTRTANFLDVMLTGAFIPGPAFSGLTPAPATAHVSFNQTGDSLSGSFTLATVPVTEPGTMVLLGSGILVFARVIRHRIRA